MIRNKPMIITRTLAWEAVKEAIAIIERVPDLETHLIQLRIIAKYADELKQKVRYDIEQLNKNCCGGQ
jgi:hypothetical protein